MRKKGCSMKWENNNLQLNAKRGMMSTNDKVIITTTILNSKYYSNHYYSLVRQTAKYLTHFAPPTRDVFFPYTQNIYQYNVIISDCKIRWTLYPLLDCIDDDDDDGYTQVGSSSFFHLYKYICVQHVHTYNTGWFCFGGRWGVLCGSEEMYVVACRWTWLSNQRFGFDKCILAHCI